MIVPHYLPVCQFKNCTSHQTEFTNNLDSQGETTLNGLIYFLPIKTKVGNYSAYKYSRKLQNYKLDVKFDL